MTETKINDILPVEIVEYYLKNGSLRKTAKEFNIHYNTLWKWVRDYQMIQDSGYRIQDDEKKEKIKERLLTGYRRPWNRFPGEVEERVALLKEKEPGITLKRAQQVLKNEGIKISIKGIWNIWKRYGYCGFDRRKLTNDFTEFGTFSKEAKAKYEKARILFNRGNLKLSTEILNSIPYLPKNELLPKIPDELLSLKRKVEKYYMLFGRLPIQVYLKRVNGLYKLCRLKHLNYSALKTGIIINIALSWKGEYQKMVKLMNELEKLFNKYEKYSSSLFPFRWTILMGKGIAYISLLDIKNSYRIARICSSMITKRKVTPFFKGNLGILYLAMELYKKAERYITEAYLKANKLMKAFFSYYLSQMHLYKADYRTTYKLLKNAQIYKYFAPSDILIFYSFLSLLKGDPLKAISLSEKALDILEKEKIKRKIFEPYLCNAVAYSCLGKREKGFELLRKILPFLKKHKIFKNAEIIENLIREKKDRNTNLLPTVRLLHIIKENSLRKAFDYSVKNGIKLYYYLYNILYPDKVYTYLKHGRKSHLPKSILKLPVFNKNAFVFDVRFLGRLKVYRRVEGERLKVKSDRWQVESERLKELLRLKLTPKEKAFLIHLALRLPEPGRTISLEKIYKNFWRDSKKPERNLSHLLTKIRKQLKIPVHLLEISRRGGYPVLKNNGIYFLTDYLEFKEKIARARALLRAEEYEFAKREFKSALKLVRGEPFKKMYDTWSEDKRMGVLFEVERAREVFYSIK